ncbi:MAG: beta-ketoacyl synthase N-terminal-like domain-containing protein [Myxococcota bacterium]
MVGVTAWALLTGARAAEFVPRQRLPERKHIKLMARSVQLGVATIGEALAARPGWERVPPERRGLFVGARPVGATTDLIPALDVSVVDGQVDLRRFGDVGLSRLHPLWLVKGLSNNIPGYACAYWDLRGPTANRCEGDAGGLAAIVEAIRAVEEGRVDLAIAGGADCLVPPPPWRTGTTGEGAGFVVLERDQGRAITGGTSLGVSGDPEDRTVDLGAATGPASLVAACEGRTAQRIEVGDAAVGLTAWVQIAADEESGESQVQ